MGSEFGDSEEEYELEDIDGTPEVFLPTGKEVSEEKKPEIGMHFDTLEAVQCFLLRMHREKGKG
jgi:hypothetical protein